jgi:hypothetical protein
MYRLVGLSTKTVGILKKRKTAKQSKFGPKKPNHSRLVVARALLSVSESLSR